MQSTSCSSGLTSGNANDKYLQPTCSAPHPKHFGCIPLITGDCSGWDVISYTGDSSGRSGRLSKQFAERNANASFFREQTLSTAEEGRQIHVIIE